MKRFNRLWIRLSLAFGSVVILSMMIIVLSTPFASQQLFSADLLQQDVESDDGILEALRTYYAQRNGWTDIRTFWAEVPHNLIFGPQGGIIISVADADGILLTGIRAGERAADQKSASSVPIVVDERLVGFVVIHQMALRLPNGFTTNLWSRITRVLVVFITAVGFVSVLFGIWTSRTLTAPLARLAQAAQVLGINKQVTPVKVEGSTEVRELAITFNEMTQRLAQSEKSRNAMVADVAHELRTPLSVLRGNLQAILEDIYPLSKAEVSKLYSQTEVLSRLVHDLHELSQADAAQLPMTMRIVDVRDVIREQFETFTIVAEQHDLTLSSTLPATPLLVRADRTRLAQVLSNLLSNAMAHTPAGGKVEVIAERAADEVHIRVRDSGEGIPAAHLPLIFERFYRADPSRSRESGGAGLGLAIAKAIMTAHGGTITVTSVGIPGQGSTFSVALKGAAETLS
jgi:signal transduction histidine kinase